MKSRLVRIGRALAVGVMLVAVPAVAPALAAQADAVPPTIEELLIALRDVDLPLENLRVRSALAGGGTGSVLLQLPQGTLVDVQLVVVEAGWSVRDFFMVAGDPNEFRSWVLPWQRRVAAAENFLASATDLIAEGRARRAQELAPLVWFEDPDESTRLWGMNPLTYRMMQALSIVPMGPMEGGDPANPMPRRRNQ